MSELPAPSVPKLIVVSGVPGTGKSALADAVAARLRSPVASKDRCEAALWRGGIGRGRRSGWIAYELLTVLAEEQLCRGQSIVIDSVAGVEAIRAEWRALAHRYAARFVGVETICTDPTVHRSRVEFRHPEVTTGYELTWGEVRAIKTRFEPWGGDRLVLDALDPFEENIDRVMAYIDEGALLD
jgi:predicted kinase